MIEFRPATEADMEGMVALDPATMEDAGRREFVRAAVGAGLGFLALMNRIPVGLAVLEGGFFGHDFIPLLVVHPDHRRCGVGFALMEHLAGQSQSTKIFTSVSAGNLAMLALLNKAGFRFSGSLHDIDPSDPELFFVRVRPNGSVAA